MLKLLERNITSIGERLVLLAPPAVDLPEYFKNVTIDPDRRRELVAEMQRLRGSIYLHDGALQREQLSPDGTHQTPEDQRSWHLLMLDKHQRVSSCVWYLEHDNTISADQLRVKNCPLGQQEGWHTRLWHAVESELARARKARLRYAEVGGWAVSNRSRCTSEGLLLALGAYSLGRVLGGALGITTATTRHSSSTILRRLGGSPLELEGLHLPSYYDAKYACEMELLRFDSRRVDAKYVGLVDLLRDKLAHVSVIATGTAAAARGLHGVFDASYERSEFAA
jgi:hypothetical protein